MALIDPLNLRNVSLNNDLYTLYWIALKKDSWDKLAEDYPNCPKLTLTNKNKNSMKLLFTFFLIVVLFTLSLMLVQVFTTEIEVYCPIQVTIIRILLVLLCQSNLTGEFRESLVKWKYTREHEDEFIEPFTAKFISFSQFLVALSSYVTLLLFICTENTPISLIMDFTGIVVFVELDDWIGEKICSAEPDLDSKNLSYYGDNIDEKLPLNMKLSKLQYYTDVIEDLNEPAFNYIIPFFGKGRYLYACLPLLVLVIERLFILYHPYVAKP